MKAEWKPSRSQAEAKWKPMEIALKLRINQNKNKKEKKKKKKEKTEQHLLFRRVFGSVTRFSEFANTLVFDLFDG